MNGKRFQSVHSKYIVFRRRYIHEKGAGLAVGRGRKRKEANKGRKIEKNERDISKVSKRKRRRRENKDPIDSAFGIWQSPCGRG